jgi:hypothetical protein
VRIADFSVPDGQSAALDVVLPDLPTPWGYDW